MKSMLEPFFEAREGTGPGARHVKLSKANADRMFMMLSVSELTKFTLGRMLSIDEECWLCKADKS